MCGLHWTTAWQNRAKPIVYWYPISHNRGRRNETTTEILWAKWYRLYFIATPSSWVLLEQPAVHKLAIKSPVFHETQRFISVSTTACHLSQSWATSVHSMTSHRITLSCRPENTGFESRQEWKTGLFPKTSWSTSSRAHPVPLFNVKGFLHVEVKAHPTTNKVNKLSYTSATLVFIRSVDSDAFTVYTSKPRKHLSSTPNVSPAPPYTLSLVLSSE